MFFSKLEPKVQQAIVDLAKDDQFQKRFATDPILDSLQSSKTNSALQLFTLRHVYKTEKLYLTPAIWSFLWVIKSPIVDDFSKVSESDIDFLFYLFENGIADASRNVSDTFSKAIGFCKNNNIDYDDAKQMIKVFISMAFRPLTQFTADGTQRIGGKPQFDADWLTALAVKVHLATGYEIDYIINDMSLTEACFYFLQYAKLNGAKNVSKKTPQELLVAMDYRATELVVDALIEKNVIALQERQNFIQIITENPSK